MTWLQKDGTMIEGVLDLAFEENGSMVVVDFKTDHELAAGEDRVPRSGAAVCECGFTRDGVTVRRCSLQGVAAERTIHSSCWRARVALTSARFFFDVSRRSFAAAPGPGRTALLRPVRCLLDERDQAFPGGFAVLALRAALARIDHQHAAGCQPVAGERHQSPLDRRPARTTDRRRNAAGPPSTPC